MSDKRKELRANIFKSSNKQIESMTISGSKVEVHQPTIGEIADLNQSEGDVEIPRRDTISDMIIKYCFVPDSNERLFSKEDKDGILNLPATVLNEFNTAFGKLTNINMEDVEKNSEGQ